MFEQRLTRRSVLAAGALAVPGIGPAALAAPAVSLLELFTSQGCSSCPAADRLAETLAQREGLLVLSFNVDYWDYLGWRDTLAKPEFSQRQYDYARTRGDGNVYTPQAIANGQIHAVGSRQDEIEHALSRSAKPDVALGLKLTGKEITVAIPKAEGAANATLWLLAVAPRLEQVIERGENAGHTLTYTNAVRNMVPAAMWSGEAYQGRWMQDAVMTADSGFCVAVLQDGKTGRVRGLARSA